jgi:hypothetical protein
MAGGSACRKALALHPPDADIRGDN